MRIKMPNHFHMNRKIIIVIVCICVLSVLLFLLARPQKLPKTKFNNHNGMIWQKDAQLMLGTKQFSVVGVNDYDLAYRNTDEIAQTFATLHSAGVTTIRFWLFGDGRSDGFQPHVGVMNESRFKQADYIFYQAKKNNMKVIPVLINNWKDYGGKDQYVRWLGKDPITDETAFYTDFTSKSLFENYIAYVLSRKNTYTHTLYSNDPTILGWDIINEPRSSDQQAMNNFLIAIALYIKRHDQNHLVFAGTEITTTQSPTDKSSNLCENNAIDICSVHLYLFNQNQPLYHQYNDIVTFMKNQKTYAQQIDKPLLLEEFGIAQSTKPFGQESLTIMKQLIKNAKQTGYNGYLIWNWSDPPDSSFAFSTHGDAAGHYSFTDLEQLLH